MSMKKFVALLLVAVLALTLCACGGSGDTNKDVKVIDISLTEEDYAFGVKKGDAELLSKVNAYIAQIKQDGTFDEICDRYFGDGTPVGVTSAKQDASKDQLIVATNADFAPFEYMKGNTFYGVDMEIAAGLAQYLGKELVILHMDFDAVCLSVSQGKADIAMAGLTVKPDREEHVTFSETYYKASQKIIVMETDTTFDNCKTVEDVEKILAAMPQGTKIGTQNGTTGQKYIKGDADWEFDGFANLECIGYKNGSLAVQNIINGNCKLVVIDEAPAGFITEALNKLN